MWYVVLAIVGLTIGFIFGWIKGINRLLENRTIGYLRVDHSDEDGPFCYMEVEPDAGDFVQRDIVILKVKHEDFIPRN